MEDYLPNASEAALYRERQNSKFQSSKINVHIDSVVIPVIDFDEKGFAVDKKYRLPKRAHVEVFDGNSSLYIGMIHYADEEQDLQRFEFKRLKPHSDQPPKDYSDDDVSIAGLLSSR